MINIQFMTEEQAKINNRGNKVYIPDYDLMIANACCEEERECIRKAKKTMERWDDGFAFSIVYTDFYESIKQDLHTMEIKRVAKWHFLQHPWYRIGYGEAEAFLSKEQMINEIAHEYMKPSISFHG